MVGVSLTDQDGNLKSALNIYKEIAVQFEKLDDVSKSMVAEGLAGKFHIARMTA